MCLVCSTGAHASTSCSLCSSDDRRQGVLHLTWLRAYRNLATQPCNLYDVMLDATFAGVLYSGGWEGG